MRSTVVRNFTSFTVSICLLFQFHIAYATSVKLPGSTRVYVETKQDLIGKGGQVREGQSDNAVVWRDVIVDGHVLITAGTPVVARVDQLKKRQIAGVKGQMTIGAYETAGRRLCGTQGRCCGSQPLSHLSENHPIFWIAPVGCERMF